MVDVASRHAVQRVRVEQTGVGGGVVPGHARQAVEVDAPVPDGVLVERRERQHASPSALEVAGFAREPGVAHARASDAAEAVHARAARHGAVVPEVAPASHRVGLLAAETFPVHSRRLRARELLLRRERDIRVNRGDGGADAGFVADGGGAVALILDARRTRHGAVLAGVRRIARALPQLVVGERAGQTLRLVDFARAVG